MDDDDWLNEMIGCMDRMQSQIDQVQSNQSKLIDILVAMNGKKEIDMKLVDNRLDVKIYNGNDKPDTNIDGSNLG